MFLLVIFLYYYYCIIWSKKAYLEAPDMIELQMNDLMNVMFCIAMFSLCSHVSHIEVKVYNYCKLT